MTSDRRGEGGVMMKQRCKDAVLLALKLEEWVMNPEMQLYRLG